MTPHGLVRPATVADAHELIANIRAEDRREMEEVGGRPLRSIILLGTLVSEPALTLRSNEGELAGILGVVRTSEDAGVIWMAGTPLIEQRSKAFLRGSIDVIQSLGEQYDLLYNICDARNEVHVRWLRWLGFHFIRKIDQHGAAKVPVLEFARIS